ncbi:hypothetical protein LX16_4905 [Stackebrandtia albiflava]|uniref:SMI1/KNR4 family protein n=1 Tax=Stackebrandtia albiflava TaxID=406432 RepID=A0A562UQ72_9ACTN|nr:SMI1/KNR4 family protein [Stackebrandtia albiflava]TWJ07744.1 hypothetical protein LX16_4905 [Stackebrandtia albiflava]
MNPLLRELSDVLCPGMRIPDEIRRLYDWIHANGAVNDSWGLLTGTLDAESDVSPACGIEFRAEGCVDLEHWFGTADPAVIRRVCVFAATGGDGSRAAFWLDDEGRQRIVHMGSGSGSTTVCLLGETPLDFLRLLAVGYQELCWSGAWSAPALDYDDEPVGTDTAYRRWLEAEFGVTVPQTGLEVATPVEMADTDPRDPFARWLLTVEG